MFVFNPNSRNRHWNIICSMVGALISMSLPRPPSHHRPLRKINWILKFCSSPHLAVFIWLLFVDDFCQIWKSNYLASKTILIGLCKWTCARAPQGWNVFFFAVAYLHNFFALNVVAYIFTNFVIYDYEHLNIFLVKWTGGYRP